MIAEDAVVNGFVPGSPTTGHNRVPDSQGRFVARCHHMVVKPGMSVCSLHKFRVKLVVPVPPKQRPIGLDPETVDYSDPALPPGMTAEKVRAGVAVALKQFTDRGW